MGAKYSCTAGMEGMRPYIGTISAASHIKTLTQLACRLIGKGDGEYLLGSGGIDGTKAAQFILGDRLGVFQIER